MSDPLDRLRAEDAGGGAPDVEVIKARARRIERRRYAALGTGAAAIAIVAVVGIVISTGPDAPTSRLAQQEDARETPAAQETATAELRASGTAAGRSAETEADTATSPAMGGATSGQAETASLQATLEVSDGPEPHRVDFTLKVCNRSASTVERTFDDAQRYDFDVSRDGELVWRWSDDQVFAQVVGRESWEPGKCKTWTETWNGTNRSGMPAPTGNYEAVGVLTTSPPLRTDAHSFCLDVC